VEVFLRSSRKFKNDDHPVCPELVQKQRGLRV